MKRPGCIAALTLLAIVFAFGFAWNTYTHSPKGAFRRHFDSIPASVSEISVHGHTALAGSDERLVFRIDDSDRDRLIELRGLVEVTDLIRTKTRMVLERDYPDALLAMQMLELAAHYGVNAERYFILTQHDRLVWYLLITDAESDRVFYQYFKT